MLRKQKLTRLFSGILAVIILFTTTYTSSINAVAQNIPYNDTQTSLIDSINKTVDINHRESNVSQEIPSLRKVNAKAYSIGNNNIKYEIFSSPIHYLDETGTYQDIDNTIIQTDELSGYKFKNNKNSWNAYFAVKESKKVLINDGKYNVSFEIINASQNTKLIKSSENENKSDYDLNLSKDGRAVIYSNIFDGIDISYTAKSKTVKEDIIIREYKGIRQFKYKLDLKNLTPALKDNQILFLDNSTNEVVSSLGKLYMYDNNNNYSEDLKYSLDQKVDGYYLTITANKEFLESSSTKYPVVIDPTYDFQWQVSNGVTYDTFVSSKYPNSNYGYSDYLYVAGSNTSQYNRTKAYIRFSDVSSIVPYDFPITSASLWLRKYSSGGSGSITPVVYAAESSWYESTLCYNNNNVTLWSMENTLNYVESAYSIMFDVTRIAQRWNHTDNSNNWGFEIDNDNADNWIAFWSSDGPTPSDGPKLEIVAEDTSGVTKTLNSWKTASASFMLYDSLSNSTYSDALCKAIAGWNRTNSHSGTGVNITLTTNSNNPHMVKVDNDLSDITYGQIAPWVLTDDTSVLCKSEISLHADNPYFSSDTSYRNGLARQQTFAHEIGHMLGLYEENDDWWEQIFPGQEKYSIMSYCGDHHETVVPSKCDIDAVYDNYN